MPASPATARPACCCRSSTAPGERADAEVAGPVAFIAGDRQSDGIFNLWSIGAQHHGALAADAGRRPAADRRRGARRDLADEWKERIGIRTPDVDNNILTLSGGNQQKMLFARALGSDAGIVLMDDPMRGVDVGTKLEVYELIRAEARGGAHLHLVHDRDRRAEPLRPRLCVPRRRASSPTSARGDLTEEKVLQASFAESA